MHTVRNRIASRPPTSTTYPAGKSPPGAAAMRHDLAYIQRGSMAVPLAVSPAVPGESGLIETRAQRRRNPKGKKARKAAERLAVLREVRPDLVEQPAARIALAAKGGGKRKGGKRAVAKVVKRPAIHSAPVPAIPATAPVQAALLAFETGSVLEQCLAAEPALTLPVLTLPVRPEPLVVAEREAAPRILSPGAVAPEPLAEAPPLPPPAAALAALANMPLPRALALVPARRQGLVEVIAFLLRDSGRRLARWSARRQKTRAEREALRSAEARQINLQRELEALDALRRNKD